MANGTVAADIVLQGTEQIDRRTAIIATCFSMGLGVPALCWLAALAGVSHDVIPLDKVATIAVIFSIYAPLLVFYDNVGERRTLDQQLIHFAWLWFFSNTGYQLFWEMPWFLMKDTLTAGGITQHDVWFWPWWAYGVADTRYLSHNDLSLTISAMDGSVALLEVIGIFLYFKGYRLLVSWIALVLGVCMGWGQYFFYIGEIYGGFSNIHDGWFGLLIKYGVMNLPWLIFPIVATIGFIWHIATIYKKRGVEQYLAKQKLRFGESFIEESDILMTTDAAGNAVPPRANQRMINRLILFAFSWPFIFLAIDIFRFYR